MHNDGRWLDATDVARLVRSGEVTAVEVVQLAIDRIEGLDSGIRALTHRFFERALERAAQGSGAAPFDGVPLLYKDLGSCEAGMPLTMGNRALAEANVRAIRDTPLAARMRAAGFVALGKTKTPELGIQPTTQPLSRGPTRNPWDRTRSPAGSSGGSAAAVAAGMVAIAHGTDSAGSLRMPAAWCGVVGLKPSRGRIPGDESLVDRALTEFVLIRTIRDAAAVLDLLADRQPGALHVAPPGMGLYARVVDRDPKPMRIGLCTRADGWHARVDPECVRAAQSVARTLAGLGHEVIEDPLELCDEAVLAPTMVITGATLRHRLGQMSKQLGRELQEDDLEPYTRALANNLPESSGAELIAALEAQQRYASRLAASWEAGGLDVLLTPTVGVPPLRLESLSPPPADPLSLREPFNRIWCFARPFNITGQPAISLPLDVTHEGLPLGVQLAAAHGREDLVLAIAGQLERVRPWATRHPQLEAT